MEDMESKKFERLVYVIGKNLEHDERRVIEDSNVMKERLSYLNSINIVNSYDFKSIIRCVEFLDYFCSNDENFKMIVDLKVNGFSNIYFIVEGLGIINSKPLESQFSRPFERGYAGVGSIEGPYKTLEESMIKEF